METYLIYAVASALIAWLHNFALKVAAVKNYNVSVINKYSYLIWVFFWFIYFLINFMHYEVWNILLIMLLSFIGSFLYSLSVFSRIKSMKNIDSVIFFPLYKTFWPIIVTFIAIFFFKETLNLKELFWIMVGIWVPLLLITKKENNIQKNLLVWIIFVLITAILTAISTSTSKEIMHWYYNVPFYILFVNIFWALFSYITFSFNKKNNHKYHNKWVIKFSILSWMLHFLSFFIFIKALEWNYAIVFTINSFSILVPIILSIFFFKEHFNLRKFIVIMLSIISILLFI